MVKLFGALDSAHSREDTNILLAQIILGSDYSWSVKELRWLLQPVSSKAIWKKSHKKKNKKEKQNPLSIIIWQ